MNQPATDQPATTDVLLANPRSFCAGVERAIEIVRTALTRYPPPVHVRKQIVHNSHVVAELERAGAVFVDDIDEVPAGATVIFSAHGVSPAVRAQAERKRLTVIDGICPLVTEVHNEARRFADRGDTIVLIGHAGHEESEGTMGEAPDRTVLVETVADVARLDIEGPVSYLTQTTLAVDEAAEIVAALRTRFPRLRGPGADDICYATTNRQRVTARRGRRRGRGAGGRVGQLVQLRAAGGDRRAHGCRGVPDRRRVRHRSTMDRR